jgi:hypothetical protein
MGLFPLTGLVLHSGVRHAVLVLTFPALIAVVGLFPNALTSIELQQIGDHILRRNFEDLGINDLAQRHYTGCKFGKTDSTKKTFGTSYKFRLHKRHIDPEPRPDRNFNLLFECDVCDQINPSGLWIKKEKVLTPLPTHQAVSQSKGWNVITKDDLRCQGKLVDDWPEDYVTKTLAQPFTYDAQINFLEEREVTPIICRCANCGSNVFCSGDDLFI